MSVEPTIALKELTQKTKSILRDLENDLTFKKEPIDWLIRVDNGKNFWSSDRYSAWGISDEVTKILEKSDQPPRQRQRNWAEEGDRLWFITNQESGNIVIAVSEFKCLKKRFDGEGITQLTNEEFGWKETGWVSNYLLLYKNRVNLELEKVSINIRGNNGCRQSTATATAEVLKESNIDLKEIFEKYS
tara:strand:- start:5713 stop:6276 length:564 start_codon:yes stop_codon:yes gene_type:complete